LSIENNIRKEIHEFEHIAENETAINEKLNELIALLTKSDLNSDTAKFFQQKFDKAIQKPEKNNETIEAFQNLDTSKASREELLDEFSILLSNNPLNSKISKRYLRGERLSKIILIIISLVLITMGFAMIIMPAPPFFEMFTVFYFSNDDGITLMDLISLLIILAGIYFLIRSITRNTVHK
jgi:hypothetical protein